MAKFIMTALAPAAAAGRPSFHTGVSMVGQGGNDYVCGHCGRVIVQDFDPATLPAGMVIVCGACDGANEMPPPN